MSKNLNDKDFIDFLIKYDALYNYLYNRIDYILHKKPNEIEIVTHLGLAFIWYDTEQEFNYWEDLDKEWLNYIYE